MAFVFFFLFFVFFFQRKEPDSSCDSSAADDPQELSRLVFSENLKHNKKLSSAAAVIGALRVKFCLLGALWTDKTKASNA